MTYLKKIHPYTISYHSRPLCWGTCSDGKSTVQNTIGRRWDPAHSLFCTSCFTSLIWIACHEGVFHQRKEMEIWRYQIRGVCCVMKNIPAPFAQKINYGTSCLQSGIVSALWLWTFALDKSLQFLESLLIFRSINCCIMRSEVQRKHLACPKTQLP